jgi:hypothetical protein
MVLNLLPILPLDGGRIALSLLPRSLAIPYSNTERYGFFVVLLLIAIPGVLGTILGPPFPRGALLRRRRHRRRPPIAAPPHVHRPRALGMRPTGRMHIGHYHGALRNWIRPARRSTSACSSRPTGTR